MKKIFSLVMTIIIIMTVTFSFTGSSVSEKISPTLTVSADNISYELSDTLYGLSLEDEGYALNGGLASELVNNNSFEYSDNATAGWNFAGVHFDVATEEKMNDNNEKYLQLTVDGNGSAENYGYTEIYNNKSFQFNSRRTQIGDMGFKEGEFYAFSAFFKNVDYVGTMSVSLNAKGNTEKYMFNIDGCTDWTKISLQIVSEVTADGSLVITFEGDGSFYMDSVSLVPVSSYGYGQWKFTSLRTDLYNAIKELSPSFIRFAENTFEDADGNSYGWKDSIGKLETRKQISTNYDDGHFYVNSNAMGFYEYLLLCENLGAVPVPVLSISTSNENTEENELERIVNEQPEDVPEEPEDTTEEVPEYEPYVQNVLDFIEYATGDETTLWGAKRVENGHEEPFKLKYIVLDDENMNENYLNKFGEVYNAVNEKYPHIQIITGSGTSIEEVYNSMWQNSDANYKNVLINEYYGSGKVSLYDNVHRYDDYERSGAQVAVESFVSNADGIGAVITRNNIRSAIENSAFLTGLERNADIVKMASYKQTLSKRNAQQDKVSLVWFDSQSLLLTADYYSQMIFANNMGTNYISTDFDMEENGVYHSVTVDTVNKVVYVKLVNTTNKPHKLNISLEGFKNVNNPSVQYMTENFKSAYNDFDEQLHVAPAEKQLAVTDNTVSYDMGSYSVSVIRIPYDKNDGTALYELPEIPIVSPYIHPAVEYALPISLVVLVLVTGIVILFVRIRHHKNAREEKE